jgi:CBS domain-containing protein
MARQIIPDIVHRQMLISARATDSVRMATRLMSEHQIGALLVMDEGHLVSIFTERDLAVRVVAEGRDPDATLLGDVSTVHPDTLAPHATPRAALKLMHKGHYRHLPIVEDGHVVGIVSVRDLYKTIIQHLEDDIIAMAHRLIKG